MFGLHPITELAFLISLLSLFVSPTLMLHPQLDQWAGEQDYSKIQWTGHNRPVEVLYCSSFQHLVAHVEVSQLPQEIHSAPPLLKYSLNVGLPVQSDVDVNAQVLEVLQHAKIFSQNTQGLFNRPLPSQVCHQLCGLGEIQKQMISSRLLNKSVLCTPPSAYHSYTQPLQRCQMTSASGMTELYWKSEVCKGRRKGDSTLPCGAPGRLSIISIRALDLLSLIAGSFSLSTSGQVQSLQHHHHKRCEGN